MTKNCLAGWAGGGTTCACSLARNVSDALRGRQTWLSNLEVGQRRIDTGALLILSAVYGVPVELIFMPPTEKRKLERMTRWMREFRALMCASESVSTLCGPDADHAPSSTAQRMTRPRR